MTRSGISLSISVGSTAVPTPDLGHLTFRTQRINVYCFELPSLWQFVMGDIESNTGVDAGREKKFGDIFGITHRYLINLYSFIQCFFTQHEKTFFHVTTKLLKILF